jgi:hypothetical protein
MSGTYQNESPLGKLITSPVERDAVHVAIIPLIAGEELHRGQKFRLGKGQQDIAYIGDYNDGEEAIGIVDPFLNEENYYIQKGETFWGLLNPNTVTGMRHHWEHPAFPQETEEEVDVHKAWLLDFCDRWNFNFKELADAALGKEDPDWRIRRRS